jgi:hypothetical protein
MDVIEWRIRRIESETRNHHLLFDSSSNSSYKFPDQSVCVETKETELPVLWLFISRFSSPLFRVIIMDSIRCRSPNENNHSKEWSSRNGVSLASDRPQLFDYDLKFCRNADKYSSSTTVPLSNVNPRTVNDHFDLTSSVKKNSLSDHELAFGFTSGHHLSSKPSRTGKSLSSSFSLLIPISALLKVSDCSLETRG